MRRVLRRLSALVRRRRLERDMDDEMRLHLELEAAELVRAGTSNEQAWRLARLSFGGMERFKEEGRDARGVQWADDFARDARLGARQMRRAKGFTAAALITLSLGIGATTAHYSMLRALLFHALPFDEPEALVALEQCGGCLRMAIGNYLTIRNESRTFSGVAAIGQSSPIMPGPERTEVLSGAPTTIELFAMTGVPAMLGRTFAPGDTVAGAPPVALLSEGAWTSRFGADSSIVGKSITLDGTPTTVVGVIPSRYAFPATVDVWTLIPLDARAVADRYWTNYTDLAKLRPGSTIADAAAELDAITGRVALAFPDAMLRQRFTVRPSWRWNEQAFIPIAIFMTAVALVLVIACTNLAGLLIARLTARSREIAVRAAMGAGRARIARQLLTETLMLSASGGVLGAITAWVLIAALRNAVPSDVIAGWSQVGMDWTVVFTALGFGALTGAIIGAGPALQFSRPDLVVMLKDGARGSGGVSGGRIRRVLVVLQVAFSIMLLVAAGLLTRTAVNVYRADIGIRADHVLTMRLRYPTELDSTRRRPADYYDRLTADIEQLPDVVRAGTVSWVPFTGFTSFGFEVEGRPPLDPGDRPSARMQAATAGYFDVMGIRIVRGRAFDARDVASSPRVVVISERGARRLFLEKDEDPIGRALILEGRRYEIVGVSHDVQHYGVQSSGTMFEVYYVQSQWPRGAVTLTVRTHGDPAAATSTVTRRIHEFDRDLGVSRVATMYAVADWWLSRYRVMAGLMVGFAVIALLISAIGLYGVISFAVAQRTREFGIRLALGAAQRDLLRLVLTDGARLTGIGVVIGLAGGVGITQAMKAVIYGVGASDPLVLGAVVVTLGLLALGASLVPARRAASVDPMTSLRAD
jgi:putative ABC transport system permease protein